MTPENRDNFIYIAGRYGQIVKFYNVEELCADKIAAIKNLMETSWAFDRFSIGAAFRLLIADLLPKDISKVIYLDADIIVNLDIKEFWQIDIANKPLASVANWDLGINHKEWYRAHYLVTSGILECNEYFCSAVLLMNLKYLRDDEAKLLEALDFVAKNTNCQFFDQDVLNYCYGKNYVHAAEKFDVYVVFERRNSKKSAQLRPAIYHYVSQSLGLDTHDIFNKLWLKYFAKTPWFNEEIFGHLYEGARQMQIQQKNFATKISEMLSGKTRAFFATPPHLEFVKKFFNVKPNEEIIPATSPQSLQDMANSILRSGGTKIFFILLPHQYAQIQEILTRAGFKQGRDFLNAENFLSPEEGVPFNSYSLVKIL